MPLPLGNCPSCRSTLYDNHADLQGRPPHLVNVICVYCGTPCRYDPLSNNYLPIDPVTLPTEDLLHVRHMQIIRQLLGPDAIMSTELNKRNANKKTS